MNRTRQSFVFARLSQKTERESVKTLLNDALHERLLLDTKNTYVTVSSAKNKLLIAGARNRHLNADD